MAKDEGARLYEECKQLRDEWRAAEDAYKEAIRRGRPPIEIEALLHLRARRPVSYGHASGAARRGRRR
jgi:hypothetical protein